jgi:hypothetical protein
VPTVVEIMQLMNAKKSRREGREKAIAKRKKEKNKQKAYQGKIGEVTWTCTPTWVSLAGGCERCMPFVDVSLLVLP